MSDDATTPWEREFTDLMDNEPVDEYKEPLKHAISSALRELIMHATTPPTANNLTDEVLSVLDAYHADHPHWVFLVTEYDHYDHNTVGEPVLFSDEDRARSYAQAMQRVRDAEFVAHKVRRGIIGGDSVDNDARFQVTRNSVYLNL